MKLIRVSDATYRMVAEMAILPFRSTGTRQPDGSWLVPIDDEVFDRLEQERLPGESDEDVAVRLVRAHLGQKPS
jgi:hypothetical protein